MSRLLRASSSILAAILLAGYVALLPVTVVAGTEPEETPVASGVAGGAGWSSTAIVVFGGQPVIAYTTGSAVKVAYKSGGSWLTETVATVTPGCDVAIACSGARIAVAFRDAAKNVKVSYTSTVGMGSWSAAVTAYTTTRDYALVDSMVWTGSEFRLVVVPSNSGGTACDVILLTSSDATSWTSTTVASAISGEYAHASVTGAGVLYAAKGSSSSLKFWNGASTETMGTADVPASQPVGPSVFLLGSSDPWALYYLGGNVYRVQRVSGTWGTPEQVATNRGGPRAVMLGGEMCIVVKNNGVWLLDPNGAGGWDETTVTSTQPSFGPSITTDGTDVLIAWQQGSSLKYRRVAKVSNGGEPEPPAPGTREHKTVDCIVKASWIGLGTPDPASLDFGIVNLAAESTGKTVQISNIGTSDGTLQVVVSGTATFGAASLTLDQRLWKPCWMPTGLGSKAQPREGRGELKLVRLQPGSGELAKPRKDGEWGEGERKGPVAASEPSEASDTQHI